MARNLLYIPSFNFIIGLYLHINGMYQKIIDYCKDHESMKLDTIPLPPYENLYGIWHTPWWHAPWVLYSSLCLCILSIILTLII